MSNYNLFDFLLGNGKSSLFFFSYIYIQVVYLLFIIHILFLFIRLGLCKLGQNWGKTFSPACSQAAAALENPEGSDQGGLRDIVQFSG